MKRLLALLTLLLVLPMSANAWWNAEWKFRKKITLDATALNAEAAATADAVPVAVRLHTGNFLFTDAKPDGSDIRFVASDDKTPLKHHVEVFDAANQLAIVWVQVPRVVSKAPNEALWMYSGNEKVAAADDAKGVYSPAQRLRLNFSEADGAFKDASPFANAVVAEGVARSEAGLAGGAAQFSGKPLKVAMGEGAKVLPDPANASAGLSVSAWVKPSAAGTAQLLAWGPLTLEMKDTQVMARLGSTVVEAAGLKPGEWHHVGVSLSDRLVLFIDGREVAAQPAAMQAFAGELSLGQGFNGELDAVEVAATARNALWFELQAAQGDQGRLLVYGEPEQAESGEDHAGYLGVLVNSLTLDAKIVIVILAVMFLIAVYVMVSKALLVVKVDRNNARFIDTFEEDPQVYLDPHSDASKQLRDGDPSRDGTLARMYATGMRELDRRVNNGKQVTSLSAESVAAIKASIDSTLIRENQKLNKLMVLLTIAISGGPFLGLLGTVVGVMITFAAIAASGDVNINSIAPGIAAALLATVAGLGVAIPSLFGYNYLLTRIKGITADMQAFSDEFITRMAEAHNQ